MHACDLAMCYTRLIWGPGVLSSCGIARDTHEAGSTFGTQSWKKSCLFAGDTPLIQSPLVQVTYYEFQKDEVDAAMEGHKNRGSKRSLTHVPSRVENKEAFNILMVRGTLLSLRNVMK